MPEPPTYPGAPRWVKIAAAIAVLALLVLLLLLLVRGPGEHGPGRHFSVAPGMSAGPIVGHG